MDYEDELLIQTAKEHSLDAIVTNNAKDFAGRGISIFATKEIMNAVSFANLNER